MGPLRQFHFVILSVVAVLLSCCGGAPARAETQVLTQVLSQVLTEVLSQDTRFCPSWAEAHERTLASLNNGRPPYPVKWKGCIVLKRGTRIEIVERQEESTEIVVRGKHWFADE